MDSGKTKREQRPGLLHAPGGIQINVIGLKEAAPKFIEADSLSMPNTSNVFKNNPKEPVYL